MILNDYECPNCGVFEAWGSAGEPSSCPTCGAESPAVIGMPGIVLPGTDPGFPRAWRRWADAHEIAGDGPIGDSRRHERPHSGERE